MPYLIVTALRFLALVIAGGAFTAGSAEAQLTTHLDTVPGMVAADPSAVTQDVAFRNDGHDRMTVPVTLGGAGPFRFLVDTGANRTAVSREVAGRLKLEPGPRAIMHSVSGSDVVTTATIRQLGLENRVIEAIDAPVLESAHMGADGVLGTDCLRSQRVLFDFRAKLLSITPASKRRQADEAGTVTVEASRLAGRLIVTEATADDQRLSVVVDTGSEVTIGNPALRRALERRGVLRWVKPVELVSVTGAVVRGEMTVLRGLEMGGVTLRELAIVFADAHTFGEMGLLEKPTLLLGMNALRAFDKVAIDFANKRLRVLLPRDAKMAER
jgi:predicted aspartyl protease